MTDKMILVDIKQFWQNYVKRKPNAKGIRNVPFPYYEDWVILFGKDRATGVLVEGPADMVDVLEKEDQTYTPIVDLLDCSLLASRIPCNQGGSGTTSKKRAREAEGIEKGLVDKAVEFGSFFEKTNTTMEEIAHRIGYAHDLSQARKLVNGELVKLPLNTNDKLRAATLIMKDAERVDLFFSLPEEDKMEWVVKILSAIDPSVTGADVNLKNDGSRTALHYATSKGWLKIAEILLSHGAKINLKDKASSTGNSELCELLIEEGAEVDTTDKPCQTPLMSAVIYINKEKETQLGLATQSAHPDIFSLLIVASESLLLIRHGANVDVEDKEGYTVLGPASVDLTPILIDAAKAMLEE
ncbi:26S proteasome non-ATPase regulatory subunit 10 [Camellia lanceoleosa]|uniref:26S proteasome non-ATPase regulatory subunit 10 n=1 Tax=Camellia lanceoleosa TaxID=1840588 RepID=A0ACC0G6F0_9ERIC|nr:26S proteasome non-ATPase regulatory subunit 10 [Camellia lanceoleosa]